MGHDGHPPKLGPFTPPLAARPLSWVVRALTSTRASNLKLQPRFIPKIAKERPYNKIIIAGRWEREEGMW